jgi:hypothetical protein
MATWPDRILQKLTETAVLCDAYSAGISILEPDVEEVYWPAIAARWAKHLAGGTLREFGPCGTVLDRTAALLFSHPERNFSFLLLRAAGIRGELGHMVLQPTIS